MVHWVFSTFGKQPVANSRTSGIYGSPPPPVAAEASQHVIRRDGQHDTVIPSPQRESKRDSDFNSQRASAGSSTLNTRPSRAQTAESSNSFGHNLRALGEAAAPAPADFFTRVTMEQPGRSESLDLGAGNEPRPSWPLPESILSGSASSSLAATSIAPVRSSGAGHSRSMSNSGRRRSGSIRMRASHELARSSSERIRRSHEHLRSNSRTGTMSPFPLGNLAEVTGPPPDGGSDEPLISRPASGQELQAALPEEPRPANRSDSLVKERKSSRKAPTITSKGSNLRNVDPGKVKSGSEAESSRAQEARRSQQALLSPRDNATPAPGSRSRDSQATALPRFLYNQSNLEEQLEAARILQNTTPSLSVASGTSSIAWRLATELYTFSYLIFFSILGTLARLGLQSLTFYPGAPLVTSVLWPNFAGSFVLGLFAEDRRMFREEWASHKPEAPSFDPKTRDITSPTSEKFHFPSRRGHRDEDQPSQVVSHGRVKKTIPLYIGLATGFCGSFTSFSSFMRDVFLSLSNNLPTPVNHTYPQGFTVPAATEAIHRNGGYSFMAVVAVILLTVCLSVGGLRFGAHFAIFLDPYLPTIRFHFLRRFIDPSFVVLGWATWLGAIIMTIWPPDRPSGPQSRGSWDMETWRGQALFACAFAPVGCLLRFYVSLSLNGFSASFPLGTFAVNIFGTAVEGMAFDLQHVRIGSTLVGGGRVPCQVLQGVMDGFCGSLTTVSTWAAELNGLKRHNAYVYGISSIVGGLSLMVAIMGSVRWTVGWSEPVCIS